MQFLVQKIYIRYAFYAFMKLLKSFIENIIVMLLWSLDNS